PLIVSTIGVKNSTKPFHAVVEPSVMLFQRLVKNSTRLFQAVLIASMIGVTTSTIPFHTVVATETIPFHSAEKNSVKASNVNTYRK
ncbi:MAG: hypothetical protein E6802_06375, partial [Staphylococcus epidermidis]|nr:hypothetical protein [Staphylococcus epidermidis]